MRKLGKRPKELHVYIATPAYDGRTYTDFALSAFEAGQICAVKGIRITACAMGNGAFIDLSRNTFVQMFLKTDCTHLMFIDADLKFEGRGIVGLVQSGFPICAGMYRRRQEPENYPVMYAQNPDGGGLWMKDGGWVQCSRVPTGFLCIRRDIVEEMAAEADIMVQEDNADYPELPWLFDVTKDRKKFPNDPRRFTLTGEDFSFCDAYIKKYGEMIPVWPDFDFKHGAFNCNFMEFLQRVADGTIEKKSDSSAAMHDVINGKLDGAPVEDTKGSTSFAPVAGTMYVAEKGQAA